MGDQQTTTGGIFGKILDVLTGKSKPTVQADTNLTVFLDQNSVATMAVTLFIVGLILIVLNRFAIRFIPS